MKKKLFLLDAYALIYRAHFAFIKNPRINSKGMDTSAIMGFTNSLFDLINREKPDYLAVAFDKGGSVDRTEIYSEYKANRPDTPEAIRIAVPYIQNLLKAMQMHYASLSLRERMQKARVTGWLCACAIGWRGQVVALVGLSKCRSACVFRQACVCSGRSFDQAPIM